MQHRFYDRQCVGPERHTMIDCYEPTEAPVVKCTTCGYYTERVWLQKSTAVIGDEIDITIRHGLCDEKTGEPVRYRSKAEIARVAKKRGLVNYVVHEGRKGGDTSPHTTRWV